MINKIQIVRTELPTGTISFGSMTWFFDCFYDHILFMISQSYIVVQNRDRQTSSKKLFIDQRNKVEFVIMFL